MAKSFKLPQVPQAAMFDKDGTMALEWQRFFLDLQTNFGDAFFGLTDSRLVSIGSDGIIASVADLTAWIAGTASEITVTDDTDGTVTLSLVVPLIVAKGGTGAITLADHGILLGSGTGAITALAEASDGQIPIGDTGADPVLALPLGTANEITVTAGAGTLTLALAVPLIVAKGGTGLTTITDHGIMVGSGTGAVTPLAVAANGQIPIGSAAADPVPNEIDGTTNQITVTNGAGTITLATPQDIHTGAQPTFAGMLLTDDLVLPKASGKGIKVDVATPTFGFADLLGDQFSRNTGASKPTLAAYNGAVNAWQFTDGDEAYLSYHIPHDYVAGTDIHLHVHWSQNAAGATGGTIDFKYFAIYAKGHNQASGSTFTSTPITATFSSIDINDGASGLNRYQQHLTEVTISAATATAALFDRDDFEPDGVIELTLEMDADNLTGTPSSPFIHYADIHYQTNAVTGTKNRTPDFYA